MEGHWIKTILAVFGILFAIGGAVSGFLQVTWLREQRKTLRWIVDALHAMRGHDVEQGAVSHPVTPSRMLKDEPRCV